MSGRKATIELGEVTHHNLKQLKRINSVVFPISYSDKFYKDILSLGDLAKLAYFNDLVVGAVCCRVESEEGKNKLYIMTLGCLAPYRRQGIGTKLLEHVLTVADKRNIKCVYLHVQVSNEDAIRFYEKFGFKIVGTKEDYYKRIDPPHAYILQKDQDQNVQVSENGPPV